MLRGKELMRDCVQLCTHGHYRKLKVLLPVCFLLSIWSLFGIFDFEVKFCHGAMRSGYLQSGTAKDPAIAIVVLWVWRIVIKKKTKNGHIICMTRVDLILQGEAVSTCNLTSMHVFSIVCMCFQTGASTTNQWVLSQSCWILTAKKNCLIYIAQWHPIVFVPGWICFLRTALQTLTTFNISNCKFSRKSRSQNCLHRGFDDLNRLLCLFDILIFHQDPLSIIWLNSKLRPNHRHHIKLKESSQKDLHSVSVYPPWN